MADQVKVTSIDVLEAFRASLIVFMSKAHRSVSEVGDDVRKTQVWLQTEQRFHWEREVRTRRKIMDGAQQEYFGARITKQEETIMRHQRAVRAARAAVDEAETKLKNVKEWARNYDSVVGPVAKRMDGLRHTLDFDLPKALAFLSQAQKTLESYAERGAPPVDVPPPAEEELQ